MPNANVRNATKKVNKSNMTIAPIPAIPRTAVAIMGVIMEFRELEK